MSMYAHKPEAKTSIPDLERLSTWPWRAMRGWNGVQGKFLWGDRRDGVGY